MCTYDLAKGEIPLITLRSIATKSSIGELLWIYQDESNDLNVLRDKYGVTWWDEWDIGNRTIGSVYGETVRRHNLMKNLLQGLKENPDGRRHIINLWQESDFLTAGCINQVQYVVLQYLVARHLNLRPGRFTWFYNNIQIYDRHLDQAHELLQRDGIECQPKIVLNEEKQNFYDFQVEDVQIVDYPKELIKKKNPQLKFEIGI